MITKNAVNNLTIGGLFLLKFIAIFLYCWLCSVTGHTQTIDSVRYYKGKLDTANYKLYMANQQVNAVKFYIKVVNRKPVNRKFFWNWITTRAMVPHPTYDDTPPKEPATKPTKK